MLCLEDESVVQTGDSGESQFVSLLRVSEDVNVGFQQIAQQLDSTACVPAGAGSMFSQPVVSGAAPPGGSTSAPPPSVIAVLLFPS